MNSLMRAAIAAVLIAGCSFAAMAQEEQEPAHPVDRNAA